VAQKPGIKSKPRSRVRAKAEIRKVYDADLAARQRALQSDPIAYLAQRKSSKVADWFKRIIALLMRKTLGRG
jgi:hypothetical protein